MTEFPELPDFLKIPQGERLAAWGDKVPSAPVAPVVVKLRPRIAKPKPGLIQVIKQKKFPAPDGSIPPEFQVWDIRKARFVDERIEHRQRLEAASKRLGIKLEKSDMEKLSIVPYLENETMPASRGRTSIKGGASDKEIMDKVVATAQKIEGELGRIEVLLPDGSVRETWTFDKDKKILHKDDVRIVIIKAKTEESEESNMPAKKAKAKKAAKKTNGAGKPGVIATIRESLKRDKGVTVEEVVAILAKAFPERKQKSMTSTAKIQLPKNAKKKEADTKRGLVYYGR